MPQTNEQPASHSGLSTQRIIVSILVGGTIFAIGVFGFLVLRSYVSVRNGIDLTQYNDQNSLTPSGSTVPVGVSDAVQVFTSDDPTLGPANAKVTIVEFGDFECPFCQQSFFILKDILAKYGDKIHFQFRDYPNVSLHPHAQAAALAAGCAQEQGKFWQFHDLLYINQENLDDASLANYAQQAGLNARDFTICYGTQRFAGEIQADLADAVKSGVVGTPTWFVNGHRIEGVIPFDVFEKIIKLGLKGKI